MTESKPNSNDSHDNFPFSLIVADIHLQPNSSDHPINTAFMKFLNEQVADAEKLYILGDLFEMWVGDDIGLEDYQPFIEKFKALTEAGVEIYLQYGNRDFLMKQQFLTTTDIQIMDDIVAVELYGESYLMLHGDQLCTDDLGYQRMRRWFRKPWVQWLFLHLSKKRRLAIGYKMRQSSKQQSQSKSMAIMDVNQNAVLELFNQYPEIKHMIHGHTHRPDHHLIHTDNKTLHRWVLGDWRPEAKIIRIDHDGLQQFESN